MIVRLAYYSNNVLRNWANAPLSFKSAALIDTRVHSTLGAIRAWDKISRQYLCGLCYAEGKRGHTAAGWSAFAVRVLYKYPRHL